MMNEMPASLGLVSITSRALKPIGSVDKNSSFTRMRRMRDRLNDILFDVILRSRFSIALQATQQRNPVLRPR